jgi:probable HAF family extracellular repeat protein
MEIESHRSVHFKRRLILAIVLTFFTIPLIASAAAAEDPPTFLLKWGSFGTGDGQFSEPWGVAVDSAGNIYVADMFNNRIQKFDSAGNFLAKWGSYGTGSGEFDEPMGVAVDSAENVYVADRWNNRIQKFDSAGNFLAKWGSYGNGDGQFFYPLGVAVDSEGNVYVTDGNVRVQKFDSAGNFLAKIGSYGTGDGQFVQQPYGVAVDSAGNLYVSETVSNRIQKFDSAGNFLAKWGSYGTGSGEFDGPMGVAVDSAGNVYVADIDNLRIQKFSASGVYLTQWGSLGSGDGQFQYPRRVAVDNTGNIYVADSGNNRIQKFRAPLFYTLTDLGTLGGTYSAPGGINNSGQVVGASLTVGDSAQHAFLFSNGTMTDLGATLGHSFAWGINTSGQVIGVHNPAPGYYATAFLYSNGPMTSLGTFGGCCSMAHDINDTGQVVGSADPAGDMGRAFIYSNGTMTDLGTFGRAISFANGINNLGQVVGCYADAYMANAHAFLYSNGTKTDIHEFGWTYSEAFGINDAGQVVGYAYTANETRPFLYNHNNGTITNLGTLLGPAYPFSINNQGQIIGQYYPAGNARAFLFSNGTVTDLTNLAERLGVNNFSFPYPCVNCINDTGQIVGFGYIGGQPNNRAILLTPTSTPASTYTITASAGQNGSISPSGAVPVNSGGIQYFSITPNAGFRVEDVLVGGVSVGAVTSYMFSNVTGDNTIAAIFTPEVITITASAGPGGSISPLGVFSVLGGTSLTFTITPDPGYRVADVAIDGYSVGATQFCQFIAGAGNTITASFIAESFVSDRVLTWATKTPMLTARLGGAVGVVDGKIYRLGGTTAIQGASPPGVRLNTVEVYDPKNDRRFMMPDLPYPISPGSSVSQGNMIYLLGGVLDSGDILPDVHAYNTIDGSLVQIGSLSTPRYRAPAVLLDNKIYVFGGQTTGSTVTPLDTLEEYDLGTRTVTNVIRLPAPRLGSAVAGIGGDIYIFGGFDGTQDVDTSWKYDPLTHVFTPLNPMPIAQRGGGAQVLSNGRIYLVGGRSNSRGGVLSSVQEYDPAHDTWQVVFDSLPTARQAAAQVVVNDSLYVIGGYGPDGQALATNEVATLNLLYWTSKTPLQSTPRGGIATGVLDGKIYLLGGRATSDGPSTDLVEVFDPSTNTYESRPPLAMPIARAISLHQGDFIYLLGGLDEVTGATSDRVLAYNMRTGEISQIGTLFTPRWRMGGVLLNNKIYIVGGLSGTASSLVPLDIIEEFDLNTNQSMIRGTLPAPRYLASVHAVGGYLYIFGGHDASQPNWPQTNTGWKYDPGANTFASVSPMPVAKNGTTPQFSANGRIYLSSGNNQGQLTDIVEEYNPATDFWRIVGFPMPTPRYAYGRAQVGDRFYYIGGFDANGQGVGANEEVTLIYPAEYPVRPGINVTSTPIPEIEVTFDTVAWGGTVTAAAIDNPSAPANFRALIGSSYDISTTATVTGPIQVCLNYSNTALSLPENEPYLQLFHLEGQTWVNITASVDTIAKKLCGMAYSLSPFVIAEPSLNANYTIAATAGSNGAISPSGSVAVSRGQNQSFSIVPATGYRVLDVTVDGASAGPRTNYLFTNVTADHTIAATFTPDVYVLSASSSGNGTISPAGDTTVSRGSSQTYNMTPAPGWHVLYVRVDSTNVGAITSYTFTNVTMNHEINAYFALIPYTISATAGTNGSISPAGSVTVYNGASQTFTITPVAGYRVADVLVDGVSIGAVTTYIFGNVTADHSIAATFVANPVYTISATAGAGGAISPSGSVAVSRGQNQSFSIVPATGYRVLDVTVDGASAGPRTSYLFTNVTADHTIAATFTPDVYVLSASSSGNGTISPVGDTTVSRGSSQTYNMTPAPGWHVLYVRVDSTNLGTPASHSFSNVTMNHTIEVKFVPDTYTIMATAGSNGSITPAGNVNVNSGASPTFTITPAAGYFVANVLVDGVSVGAVSSYTFPPVSGPHTIAASYSASPTYTITASAGGNGSITPSGAIPIPRGTSKTFTITSATGYRVGDVLVDGNSVGARNSYYFRNVTADHTISATFVPDVFSITASIKSGNGSISPAGSVMVNRGGSQTYNITPAPGWRVLYVWVDGSNKGSLTEYTFTNVTYNRTIQAYFVTE